MNEDLSTVLELSNASRKINPEERMLSGKNAFRFLNGSENS